VRVNGEKVSKAPAPSTAGDGEVLWTGGKWQFPRVAGARSCDR
jgi:hypothetical protein